MRLFVFLLPLLSRACDLHLLGHVDSHGGWHDGQTPLKGAAGPMIAGSSLPMACCSSKTATDGPEGPAAGTLSRLELQGCFR